VVSTAKKYTLAEALMKIAERASLGSEAEHRAVCDAIREHGDRITLKRKPTDDKPTDDAPDA
jgi:hypothetical protein